MKKFLLVLSIAATLAFSACKGTSDADLQKLAAEKTKDVAGVTVAVKDGVATLTGEVADAAAKAKAEAAAKVEGVKLVDSKLTVKPTPAPIVATTDPNLKGNIEKALQAKGFKDVTVDVTTTPATLRGTVAKGKLAEVMQAAQGANGGKPVKNEVTEK
jgi:hyperosmotically inducible periplasmic protein